MRAPVEVRSVSAPGAWLIAVCAAGCAAAPVRGRVPSSASASDAAVVYLSSECTGVLVGPRVVLTAAHCVEDAGPWRVRVVAPADRGRIEVIACAVHPSAYDAPRPCGAGPGRTAPEHDLALLTLARAPTGVRPLEILLTAPHPAADWWRGRRVRLVGWHRRPRVVGPLSREGGPNRIVALGRARFRTAPLARAGFATRVGDSGSPALLPMGDRELVLGVLWGGPAPGARASIYAATYAPDNARWLLSRGPPALGRDLDHLDPDDPWDRADWAELALRLRGPASATRVTGGGNPR